MLQTQSQQSLEEEATMTRAMLVGRWMLAGERQIKGHQSDFKTFTLLGGIHQQFVNMSASSYQ